MQRRPYIVTALAICGVAALLTNVIPAGAQQAGQGPGMGPGPGQGAPPGPGGPPGMGPGGPPGMGMGPGPGGHVSPGNARGDGADNSGLFAAPSARSLFGSPDRDEPASRPAAKSLGHDDALTERRAGKIIPFKDALKAANPGNAKVIEVKLIADDRIAVYRIKLRFDDGSIKSVTVNAQTGDVGGLF
ncbi:MAG TPA: hypothetical protein VN112_10655 [Ensifer sp.]|nr:hypothetical protein [Ensifer sp.]